MVPSLALERHECGGLVEAFAQTAMWLMALSETSLPRGNLIAFGVKRTSVRAGHRTGVYERLHS
jgi:hypothetical protein